MKVIVTGATGTAGREVVAHCLASERVSRVVILTRRAVPGDVESHPKAEVVMHHDFCHYSAALLRRLEGAEACLWAIGSTTDKDTDKAAARRVAVDMPLAAARAFAAHLADKTPGGGPFRFVFCSAKHAGRPLLFMGAARARLVGEAEKGLGDVAGGRFEVYALRPAPFGGAPARRLGGGSHGRASVAPVQVGKAMMRVACDGWKDGVVDNDALASM